MSDHPQQAADPAEEVPTVPQTFEQAVLARLDRIIELLSARPVQQPKADPNIEITETVAMGKTYVRETNKLTGKVTNYVR